MAPFGKGFRLLYREEPIIVNGQPSGAITSGMYGHRVEASLGMGYVRAEEPVTADWLAAQKFEIEIGWERYEAHAQSSAASRATLEALKDA